MCGLAAGRGAVSPAMVEEMMTLQAHRGPDDAGVFVQPETGAVLGHRRLAIIDPARGQQPLVADDGAHALIANGMIYNYRELRAELPPAAADTASDAETLLRLYRRYDGMAVRHMDGMFAFVLGDAGRARLLAARDPVGIKPLYRLRAPGRELFASEIKALLPFAGDIDEFPPGHVMDTASGRTLPYYRLPDGRIRWSDAETAAEAVRRSLERSVRKRLASDVPLGVFLSGGLDSSIVAALARRNMDELHTFAAGVAGSPDLAAARRVARHLGTVHHEYVIAPDEVVRDLPRILWHLESFDLDLVRSAVPCWFVAKLAAEHVKVVLTGEGADELFAGYRYLARLANGDALHAELRRGVAGLHDLNLQRVDRMTMAHGLEARVPFLDVETIETGLAIDPALKIAHGAEKWILRHAFADLLPADIVWRGKAQFDEGSGLAGLLSALGETHGRPCAEARNAEEGWYRDTLAAQFDDPDRLLALVSHWQGTLVA